MAWDRRDFEQNTFGMLVQGYRKIMPVGIRADDTADRTSAWPKSPAYRAKVVASFAYGDFDPLATTHLFVFPRTGGGISFYLDFAAIPPPSPSPPPFFSLRISGGLYCTRTT